MEIVIEVLLLCVDSMTRVTLSQHRHTATTSRDLGSELADKACNSCLVCLHYCVAVTTQIEC